MSNLVLAAGGDDAYTISRSVRLRSSASAYLSRTPASAGNRQTWTWSGWVKRGALGAQTYLFGTNTGSATYIRFESNDTLTFYSFNGSFLFQLVPSQVFRDPAAWYHFVFVLDTTNATSANRAKIYVNGVQVSAFSTATYPSLNASYDVNTASLHTLMAYNAPSNYTDGYLAEVNFIDGQALTPSSFGQNDPITGVWKPKKYAGTYGNNGFYLPFSDNSAVNALGLDLSGNTSGSSDTAPVTLGTNGTGWTGVGIRQVIPSSAIVWNGNKCRIKLTGGGSGLTVVGCSIGKKAASGNAWDFDGNQVAVTFSGSASVSIGVNTTVYSDWITFPISTANSYVVGIAISNTGTNTVQRGTNTGFSCYEKAGGYTDATSTAPSGYSSSASNTSLYAGLELQANNWTTNNISLTAGATYDSMTDVPTLGASASNYAVLNPLDQHGTSAYATVADGNLYWYGSYNTQNGHGIRSTLKVRPTGKWYVEAQNITYSGSGNSCTLGFTSSNQPPTATAFGGTLTPWIGIDASVYSNTVSLTSNGSSASPSSGTLFPGCLSGDQFSLAIDFDAGKFWVAKNGVWYNSGNPSAGTNATATFAAGMEDWAFWAEYVASSDNSNRSSVKVNFGQRPFAYTPPTGFKALNTFNLPDSSIKAGNKHFDIALQSGTGVAKSITGLAFQPDLFWGKARNAGAYHTLTDSVRGVTKVLSSNDTSGDYTDTTNSYITSFNADGVSLGTNSDTTYGFNYSGQTYVDWMWKAGGTAVSNTAGSITSQVSANTTAGFSIVTYTGTGANATVGHGLGVAPKFVMYKKRNGSYDGCVYHKSITAAKRLVLFSTSSGTLGEATDSTFFQSTDPSSSVLYLGTREHLNGAYDYVAYCFSEVAGFSKFGSYTGNGSSDGPFVYCGFRPRYVMWKNASAASQWRIHDTARDTYNASLLSLRANDSVAESATGAGDTIDVLSNGFKVRTTGTDINDVSNTYIFAAFAENPFKNSLAR